MSKGTIYLVDGNGALTRMTPGAPPNEDHIQSLIASHPDLIGDSDGALLLIRREQTIADSADGGGRWSLDHLFVTRDAVPVLVEVKRAVDTRLRREVVGQMLDYAANGVAYWRPGRIADEFAASCVKAKVSADEALQEFLGEVDPTNFWDQVDSNLQSGRIKLVFVADEIPTELARIVEFLNAQISIAGAFNALDGRRVYPLHLWNQGGIVSISFRYLLRRPGLEHEADRRRHYDAFRQVLGSLSTTSLTCSPGFPVERLADPAIRAALTPAAKAFVEAAERA